MPDTSPKLRTAVATFKIVAWRPVLKNSLIGFATVSQPSGLVIGDIAIHQRDGKCWALPPSLPMLDRDKRQMSDAVGKLRWSPVITFIDRQTQTAWSDAVVAALHISHPDALARPL